MVEVKGGKLMSRACLVSKSPVPNAREKKLEHTTRTFLVTQPPTLILSTHELDTDDDGRGTKHLQGLVPVQVPHCLCL